MSPEKAELVASIDAMIAGLQRQRAKLTGETQPKPRPNPVWFLPGSNRLSPEGVDYLKQRAAAGAYAAQIAQEMGIHPTSVAARLA